MKRGDVVLVDFPYSDQTGSKLRPALVVQADALNQKLDDTILALITSSRRRMVGSPTQLVIEVATAEGRQTGLRMDSVVQCENLVTREQRLLTKKLGDFTDYTGCYLGNQTVKPHPCPTRFKARWLIPNAPDSGSRKSCCRSRTAHAATDAVGIKDRNRLLIGREKYAS